MNDLQRDQRLRQLVRELAGAAQPPPTWEAVHERAQRSDEPPTPRSRQRLLIGVAAAMMVVAAVAVLAVLPGRDDPTPATQPEPSAVLPPPTPTGPPVSRTTLQRANCSDEPLVLVRALMEERVAGTVDGNCVDVAGLVSGESDRPPCWIRCRDGRRVTGYELGTEAGELMIPGVPARAWSVAAAVDLSSPDGPAERAIESWELTEQEDGDLAVTRVDAVPTAATERSARRTVMEYLEALADGRYGDAATVLDRGAVGVEERDDLMQLPGAPTFRDGLAAALRSWCRTAVCDRPVSLVSEPQIGGRGAAVVATFDIDGQRITAEFSAGIWEGQPEVFGIPPQRP